MAYVIWDKLGINWGLHKHRFVMHLHRLVLFEFGNLD